MLLNSPKPKLEE